MAQFVIGSDLVDDSVRKEKERKDQENQEKARRHYKKDSRWLLPCFLFPQLVAGTWRIFTP